MSTPVQNAGSKISSLFDHVANRSRQFGRSTLPGA
jgi:hypothetical protein